MKTRRGFWRRLVFGIGAVVLGVVGLWWCRTQPVWVVGNKTVDADRWAHLPVANNRLLAWVEQNGSRIAPSYEQVVCTEFVIDAVQHIVPLSRREKNDVRIIISGNLEEQIVAERPVIKGVQTALVAANKGMAIAPEDVQPGDLVQYWTFYCGKAFGHCGIVLDIDPGRTLTLYSSHPVTGGYGKQVYLWPDYSYFVRLTP
jgi:hypothetical protein